MPPEASCVKITTASGAFNVKPLILRKVAPVASAIRLLPSMIKGDSWQDQSYMKRLIHKLLHQIHIQNTVLALIRLAPIKFHHGFLYHHYAQIKAFDVQEKQFQPKFNLVHSLFGKLMKCIPVLFYHRFSGFRLRLKVLLIGGKSKSLRAIHEVQHIAFVGFGLVKHFFWKENPHGIPCGSNFNFHVAAPYTMMLLRSIGAPDKAAQERRSSAVFVCALLAQASYTPASYRRYFALKIKHQQPRKEC